MVWHRIQFLYRRWLTPILAGFVGGELVFCVVWGTGEDFWQHYYAGSAIAHQAAITNYNYPAAVALFFVPLSVLPETTARLIWLGLTYLFFALAFHFFAFSLRDILIWLAWPPVFISAFAGQVDCLVVLSMALAWFWYTHRRELTAGMTMILGLVKPHLFLPLVFLGLLAGRRRWLRGFLIVATLFGAISALLPQAYPGRMDYILSWYVQQPRGIGLPSRANGWPIEWWLILVLVLGLGWIVLAFLNRKLGLLSLPLVHPYFLAFDLPMIIPVLAKTRFVPLLYIIIGIPALWWSGGTLIYIGLGFGLLIAGYDIFRQRKTLRII